eukprot:scaffold385337_cov75-Attheya_sp.AAC.1
MSFDQHLHEIPGYTGTRAMMDESLHMLTALIMVHVSPTKSVQWQWPIENRPWNGVRNME